MSPAADRRAWKLPIFVMAMVFTGGTAAGLMSDGVSGTIRDWRDKQANPPKALLPAHIARMQVEPAHYGQASPVRVIPAYFPANNRIDWKISMAAGDTPSALAVQNSSLEFNRILLFHIADWHGSWLPAATLYLQAGRQSEIRLPRGRYMIQSIKIPVDMPFEKANQLRPTNLAQVDLFTPQNRKFANLRLTVLGNDSVTSYRLDTRELASHPQAIQQPIADASVAVSSQPARVADLRQSSVRSPVRTTSLETSYENGQAEDYSTLLLAASSQEALDDNNPG